jgi:hypothetical protein
MKSIGLSASSILAAALRTVPWMVAMLETALLAASRFASTSFVGPGTMEGFSFASSDWCEVNYLRDLQNIGAITWPALEEAFPFSGNHPFTLWDQLGIDRVFGRCNWCEYQTIDAR